VELAKQWGVSFVQLLEPRAVGHYAGKDVFVSAEQLQLLEDFFIEYNFNRTHTQYPLIVYHGFYQQARGLWRRRQALCICGYRWGCA
jgi:hypothetical protein